MATVSYIVNPKKNLKDREQMNRNSPKILIALMIMVSCAFSQAPSLLGNSVRKLRLHGIEIKGNASIDKLVIERKLEVKLGNEYTPSAIKLKVKNSIKALYKLGLFSDIAVDLNEEKEANSVVLVISVKVHPTLGEIILEGTDKLDEDDIREKMELIDGQVFSPSDVEVEQKAILDFYREEGYLLASVRVKEVVDGETEKVDLTFVVTEGDKVKVKTVKIKGNKEIKTGKIKGSMVTKQKSWFFGIGGEYKEEEYQNSLDSIIHYYRQKGYLDASIVSEQISYSDDRKFIDIAIEVSEGIEYKFGKVKFVHNDIMDERGMRQQVMLDSGDVVNILKLDASKYQVEAMFRNVGYLFVQVHEQRVYRDSMVDVTYTIKEGNIAHINKVFVRGNSKTKDKVVRREIKIFPGDVFSQALVMRSQRDVMQLNFFDQVAPNYEPIGDDDVDLVFNVQEKEAGTGTFSAGAAYSQNQGFVGTLGLQIPNFLGNGQKADLNVEVGQLKKLFSIGFTEPWFLDTRTLVGGSVFWQDQDYSRSYNSNSLLGSSRFKSYGGTVRLGRRLNWPDDYFSIFTSYKIAVNDNGSAVNRDQFLQYSGLESSMSVTLTRDDKDLPLFPTEGSKYTFTLKQYGQFLGGDFNYRKFETKISWWFPTIEKLTLGVHTEMGILDGENVQHVDLYRMGGALGYNAKLRGFHAGVIGQNVVGRSFFSMVSELVYPVAPQVFYLLGFVDMGNVYGETQITSTNRTSITRSSLRNPLEEVDLSDLNVGYGVGFRLIIPMMGRIGFDFARHVGDNFKNGKQIAEKNWDYHFVLEAPFD